MKYDIAIFSYHYILQTPLIFIQTKIKCINCKNILFDIHQVYFMSFLLIYKGGNAYT